MKNADEYKKNLLEKFFQQCQDNFLILLKKKSSGIFYELFRLGHCLFFSGSGAAWLARLPWEQEVGGSNPLSPITPSDDGLKNIRLCAIVGKLKSYRAPVAQVDRAAAF